MTGWDGEIWRRSLLVRASVGAAAISPLAAFLASCGGSGGGASASASLDPLTWASSEPIESLSGRELGAASIAGVRLGLEGLLTYDASGKLKPQLAESWNRPNPTTLVYKLRKGVTFWDGTPLTPADVVYTMEQQRDPSFKSTQSLYYESIKTIAATGSDEVTITLSKPDVLAQYPAAITGIVSKKFWEANAQEIGTPGTLTMGTGPWQFTDFNPNGHLDLKAFDGYWGGKPEIEKITMTVISSDSSLLLAMRSGQVKGTFSVPIAHAEPWEALGNAAVTYAPQLKSYFLAPNQTIEPWGDIHVRRALAHCVDKEGLLNAAFRGHGEAAPTIVAPQQWKVLVDETQIKDIYGRFPDLPFDVEAAKQELSQSSVPNGFSETLECPSSEPELVQVAQAIAQSLSQIGVKLSVKEVPASQWENDLFSGTKGLQIAGFTPDLPDPANLPRALLVSEGFANLAKYSDKQVDALLEKNAAETSPTGRAGTLAELLEIAGAAVAYVPIVYSQFGMAIDNGLAYEELGPWYMYENWATKVHAA